MDPGSRIGCLHYHHLLRQHKSNAHAPPVSAFSPSCQARPYSIVGDDAPAPPWPPLPRLEPCHHRRAVQRYYLQAWQTEPALRPGQANRPGTHIRGPRRLCPPLRARLPFSVAYLHDKSGTLFFTQTDRGPSPPFSFPLLLAPSPYSLLRKPGIT